MSRGGLIVNRVHVDGLGDSSEPRTSQALLRAELGERLAGRVAGNLADFDVLARRDRETIARADAGASGEPARPCSCRSLDGETSQDLAGLARVAERLLALQPRRAARRAALRARRRRRARRPASRRRRGERASRVGSRCSSAARRRSSRGRGARWPQIDIAQQRAQMVGDRRAASVCRGSRARRGGAGDRPARSSASACSDALGQPRTRSLRRRAERGQPPGEQAAGAGPRARAARAAPAGCRSAPRSGCRARSPARSAAAPTPARCRAARGARRGCRTRAARPPARR